MMRDYALSLEVLGETAEAESVYRRAKAGGGMCGTSTSAVLEDQIEGVIRTAERARGCRAAVAERLFATGDVHDLLGPDLLEARGFDVPRLYRGALAALGRSDREALEKALDASPYAAEGRARLERLGPEAWGTVVRAIPGLADTAGGASVEPLLAVALRGSDEERVLAIQALSILLEDLGEDPCNPGRFRTRASHSGPSGRHVRGVMFECETRVSSDVVDGAVKTITTLHRDTNAEIREAVALFLGRTGVSSSRTTLRALAKDKHENGEICTERTGSKRDCKPHRPVAEAAQQGLAQLTETEKNRREAKVVR